jgi:glycosyltransferase involved in cell wall biosynthesis
MRILQLHGYTHDVAGYRDELEWLERVNPEIDCWRYSWSRLNKEKKAVIQVCSFTKNKKFISLNKDDIEYLFFPVIMPKFYYHRFGSLSPSCFEFIMKNKWDYVIYHYIEGIFNWKLAESLRKKNMPYGIYFRWKEKKSRFDFLRDFMKRRIIEGASFLIVPSDTQKEHLKKVFRLDKMFMYTLYSAIRTDIYRPLPEIQKKPYPGLLIVAKVMKDKGILEAVKCLEFVRRYFPQATLEIVGREVDAQYSDRIKNYIQQNNLSDYIIFSGHVNSLDLAEKYNSSHLMVFPSKSEGSPKVVMESMACGVSVVALSNSGGHEEIIEHNINGWLVSPQELNETGKD